MAVEARARLRRPRVVVAAFATLLVVGVGVALFVSGAGGPDVRVLQAGSTTLLTHRASGASADALLEGRLGTNAAGCITVGRAVVILPFGSTTDSRGTVVIGGDAAVGKAPNPAHPGDLVSLGGGFSDPEPEARRACGAHATFFWAG